jgi:hypothetical protein
MLPQLHLDEKLITVIMLNQLLSTKKSLLPAFSPHGVLSFLGIEATSGLAVGTLLGVAKG